MTVKSSVIALITCFIGFTSIFAQEAQCINLPLPNLILQTSIPTQETQDQKEGIFLFNPTKLKASDFLLSINGGLPIPNLATVR